MDQTPTPRHTFYPAVFVGIIFVCMVLAGAIQAGVQWLPDAHDLATSEKQLPPPLHEDNKRTEVHTPLPKQPPNNEVDCTKVPCLALTFDDGPHPVHTAHLLDILEREQVHATFFLVGSRVHGQEALLRRMFYGGHEIGNHSWNHPDMTTLSASDMAAQVNQTQAAIAAADVPAPTLFRPPYGAVNATVRNSVPLTLALWNDDPLDWKSKDPVAMSDTIIAHARPGGVIDMHDIYPVTVDAMELAIPVLKATYHLVTFSELTNVQPGMRGEYFGR